MTPFNSIQPIETVAPLDTLLQTEDQIKLQQDQLNQFKGYDHLTFYVGSAKLVAYYFVRTFGFHLYCHANLETNSKMVTRYAVKNNDIILQFISGTRPLSDTSGQNYVFSDEWHIREIYDHITKHGDSVKDVAFQVDNVFKVYDHAVNIGGCRGIDPPNIYHDELGTIVIAKVAGIGSTVHTLVDRRNYFGFLPNCFFKYNDDSTIYDGETVYDGSEDSKVVSPILSDSDMTVTPEGSVSDDGRLDINSNDALPIHLYTIDHCVQNVDWYKMAQGVEFYSKVFGFHVFWSVDDKQVHTDYSALKSTVMASLNNVVKMPINEPAKGLKKSQIEEFIEFNGGPGVQHIALLTDDIITTITNLKKRGVDFISVPNTYYDNLLLRLQNEHGPKIIEPIEKLRELGVLIDFDEHGYLLQLFTRPIFDRPTIFFEIIQRHNHNGFGAGNFKSLFEVLEIDQKKRGNLIDQMDPMDFDREVEYSLDGGVSQ